jgi:hypothetical protein
MDSSLDYADLGLFAPFSSMQKPASQREIIIAVYNALMWLKRTNPHF